jgi:FKBP-type peptidyl-prolyl cis-trans isomerase FkpA
MKTTRRRISTFVVSLASLGLLGSFAGCGRLPGGGGGTPKTEQDKTFYALGQVIGHNVAVFDLKPAELEMVKSGLTDAVLKRKPVVEGDAYRQKIDELAQSRAEASNKTVIDAAAREPGAVKTPSGMVIRTIHPGTGPSPEPSSQVKVHYEGRLADGTIFDSSRKRGEPATFPLNGVIKCWTEGVARMKVGERAVLTCPSELAYGRMGHPPAIPGSAPLIFDVELLEIVK